MTVRQIFYRLVSAGMVDKTEGEYNQAVIRLLTEMRLDGVLPFDWIADNTRWMRKPDSFASIGAAIRKTAEFYRQALWRDLPVYCEVWLEKEALAGGPAVTSASPLKVCWPSRLVISTISL